MSDPLLKVDSVTKNFGGFTALSNVTTEVHAGERSGLIGPNGSGKTTLINCISGTLHNDGGNIIFDGHDLNGMQAHKRTAAGITRTFQIPRPFHSMTVLDNLKIPIEFVSGATGGQQEIADQAMSILETMNMEPLMRLVTLHILAVRLELNHQTRDTIVSILALGILFH